MICDFRNSARGHLAVWNLLWHSQRTKLCVTTFHSRQKFAPPLQKRQEPQVKQHDLSSPTGLAEPKRTPALIWSEERRSGAKNLFASASFFTGAEACIPLAKAAATTGETICPQLTCRLARSKAHTCIDMERREYRSASESKNPSVR